MDIIFFIAIRKPLTCMLSFILAQLAAQPGFAESLKFKLTSLSEFGTLQRVY